MKIILIFVFILASLFANKAVKNDILGGNGSKKIQLINGASNGKISLVADINITNISQFAIVNSTTLTGTVNGLIILNDITYKGKNPISASIVGNKLTFIFDMNDTGLTTSDKLKIGAGILRDGAQGGALNDPIETANGDIIDKAKPFIVSSETIDSGPNGNIDTIKLTFSENANMNGNVSKAFSVTGYTIPSSVITPSTSYSTKIINIILTPLATYDTGAKPDTTYSTTIDGNVTDSAGNSAVSSSITGKDTAKPRLVSIYGISKHNAGDEIHLGFSEKINEQALRDGNMTLTGIEGNNVDKSTTTFSPDGINATIVLNEEIDETYFGSAKTPKIEIAATAKDRNGNTFTAHSKTASAVTIEDINFTIHTKLEKGEGNKKLILKFGENVKAGNADSEDEDNYKIYERNTTKAPQSIVTTISSSFVRPDLAKLNDDKKSVTLTIDSNLSYSSSETREIVIQVDKGSIKDIGEGGTIGADVNATYEIGKDQIHPLATSFKINMDTGQLMISFNEKMAVFGLDPTKIDINISDILSKPLTEESKKGVFYSGNDVNISLNGDLNLIKDFLKNERDINLTISSGSGIVDFASNNFAGGNVSLAHFTPDATEPKLISWEYDLDGKKFTLLFDEDMNVSSNYNPTKIKIDDQNASVAGLPLSASKSSAKATSIDGKVEINILGSQVNAILQARSDLGDLKDINSSQAFINFIDGSGITDSQGNEINPVSIPVATKYTSSQNGVATLKVVPNRWNHISVDNNTTSNDILSTGLVSYIYGRDASGFIKFPATLSSHKGYWIKTSNASGTTFPVPAIKNVKGNKEDDLTRIRSKTDGKFHLIGIENDLTYEEIQAKTPSVCKSMRIHHYVSAVDKNEEGWDVNKSLSANDALWVLCIK